jgi:hypothetical protein
MEFTLVDNRRCQIITIFIRCILFIFDIICIVNSYDSIEINKLFYLYCATLTAIFASIANLIRYELIYWNNKGRIFDTKEEYKLWKIQNFSNIKYSFAAIECVCKIALLFQTPLMKEEKLYYISIFIIQLNAISILIVSGLFSIYAFFTFLCNPYFCINLDKNNKLECPICLDKNDKEWVTTKCNHRFHRDCLNEWVKISNTCPICRG